MKSDLPKVLHKVANRSMIGHVLDAVAPLKPERTVVVLAPGMDAVASAAAPAIIAIQEQPLGTGHAVLSARAAIEEAQEIEDVVVLFGDTPFLETATIAALLEERRREPEAAVALIAMRPPEPGLYGRVVTAADGSVEAIVEAKDASPEQRRITLCNGGVMAIAARHLFPLLDAVGNGNAQGEYYLTGIVALARAQGLGVRAWEVPEAETYGIDSRERLAAAEAMMQQKLRRRAQDGGTTLVAPETVFLSADTRLGRDVTIGPYVVFGLGVTVDDGAEILSFSHLTGAHVGRNAIVGPFARLRPGADIGEDAHIGNFVEVKQSRIGRGAKANHLTYLGDAEVGPKANIGAGTITCNYDGFTKEKTRIGAGAFIGSNTSLVAPLLIGDGAIIGAGSVVTSDVPEDGLSVERGQQTTYPGKAKRMRAVKSAAKLARAASPNTK